MPASALRLLALTRYSRLGASSRVRLLQFVPGLGEQNIQVEVVPLLEDEYLRRRYAGARRPWLTIATGYVRRILRALAAGRHDLIWIQQEALPGLPAVVESALIRGRYVVDCDDAWFHAYDRHPSPVVRALLAHKIDRVMQRSAVVIAGNRYIAERAARAGAPRIERLPSVVDVRRYPVKDYRSAEVGSAGPRRFVVGWIGSPSTVKYLQLVAPALEQVGQRVPTVLRVVGATAPTLQNVQVESLPWSEKEEGQRISEFDVGIMPLFDGPWEQGKCGYKLIQYMACALPVVGSNVGVNCEIVEHGRQGYLAESTAEWAKHLLALSRDAKLREELGRTARERVTERYSHAAILPRLASILRSAAKNSREAYPRA